MHQLVHALEQCRYRLHFDFLTSGNQSILVVAMKLVLTTTDDRRIARYGVSDFQTNTDGSVTLFYPKEARDHRDAPDEERFVASISHGMDNQNFDDPTLAEEDYLYEYRQADDFEDYQRNAPAIPTQIP